MDDVSTRATVGNGSEDEVSKTAGSCSSIWSTDGRRRKHHDSDGLRVVGQLVVREIVGRRLRWDVGNDVGDRSKWK
jgi:hypothetical protein